MGFAKLLKENQLSKILSNAPAPDLALAWSLFFT